MRKLLAALAISALVLTTSACANDSLADQFRSGDNKNYIEMPELVELQTEFLPEGVQFIGVNVRDSAETSLAFARRIDMNFPSVMDAKTGSVVLGFTGVVTPQAVPTTLVIDAEGNVSARVLGRIDKGILTTLVKTVIEERK